MDLFDLEMLVPDAVQAAIESQDPDLFAEWMVNHVHEYLKDSSIVQDDLFSSMDKIDEMLLNSFAHLFSHTLWNVTPLPRNNFRPEPKPLPGRNSPCPCGSGRKFKRCCQPAYSQLPPFTLDNIWPVVLDVIDDDLREQAIQSKRIPIDSLALLAKNLLDDNKPKRGLALLEPLFREKIQGTDDRYVFALDTLFDVYDYLSYNKKKRRLLDHVIETAGRSPLRSSAWQRLAAIRMDEGDNPGSWQALQHAQRDDPGNPHLGILEIQLLISENRTKEAQERARFWHKQMKSFGPDGESLSDFFSSVIRDPHQALLDITSSPDKTSDQQLQAWLEQSSNRPLPSYGIEIYDTVADEGPGDANGLAEQALERLEGLDLPDDILDDFLDQLASEDLDHEEVSEYLKGRTLASLEPPAKLASTELEWSHYFPLEKPFSVHDAPFSELDPWSPDIAPTWIDVLGHHPEAFDDLNILDDLANAILLHPASPSPWIDIKLLEPVLKRSIAILDKALEAAGTPPPVLEWPVEENRPPLRSLIRLMQMEQRRGNADLAMRYTNRLLLLNPHDNHGVRTLVMNHLLLQNENEQAIALANNYPRDAHPDLPFGKALALFRLGDRGRAIEALHDAVDHFPKVVSMLTRKSPRQPKLSDMGVTMGGDDQAWVYRQDARELWLETPGAMAWMKRFK